jgi:two-component system CheB/CheR fusion protein
MSKPKQPKGSEASTQQVQPSNLLFPVVGLGASAGGLPALLRFFECMPDDNGMAFVVVMHLSPNHESSADQALQKVTRMPVRQIRKPTLIENNCVYIISPAHQLSMTDGYLRVTEPEPGQPRHIAIDIFMRTLADAHREHAISIILSGAGHDGSVGLARVKEQGGVTIAQTPEEAEYESMPRSAIATGRVDFILPVAEMPQKLIDLWDNMQRIQLPREAGALIPLQPIDDPEQARSAEAALREIIVVLRSRTGHDFKRYKRATVLRRIERRMQVNRMSDLPSYRDFLEGHPEETPELLSDMLIGVTNFFRDRESFETLERDIVPRLFELPQENDPLRVWSAGCSSGEEAYSLAMLLADHAEFTENHCGFQVFATDIDEGAIAIGRSGVYPEAIVTEIPPSRLRQYFGKEQARYRVKKEIRERVLFALHNLLRDPPFSKLHLISCRNLLIYLDREVQTEILQMFHFALVPGGYLFLGSSESADVCADLFAPVDKEHRIYRAKVASSTLRPSPPMLTKYVGTRAPNAERSLERRKVSFADIHQRVLEQYAPPSVVVNGASEIVHMSDRAGRFLRYVGGEPSHNILSLVHPALRLELRTALFQALQTGKSVEAHGAQIERDGRTFYVNMVARPFHDHDADFVLVLFDEVEESMSSEAKSPRDQTKDSVLSQLEGELQRTKEQLQETIEQSETSTEELKASNEELQVINEELRSTTEELETSKEELQSINEELITVNQELKSKVEETGKINDDLQNLIASTDIATVFVDRRMRIKSYTPRATDIFSVINSDTGRSLLDITHRLDYPEMAADAAESFESLKTIEREVRSTDGNWYIARSLPYRTTENFIDGAVLTFIDITERRNAEEALRQGEERMHLVAESTQDYIILTLDTEGLIVSWNRGAERVFGYTDDEVLGKPFDIIFVEEDRAAGAPQKELRLAQEVGRAEDERWHLRKDGTRFYCSGVTTSLQSGGLHGFAKIGRDITEKKRQEAEQESQLEQTQETSKLKDEFFAMMSHELKHPLNLIQLNADLINRLSVVKSQAVAARAVDTILYAVRSQARIIDDLLDLSRINTGKLKLNREPVLMQQTLADIVDVVQAEATARDIAIELDMPPASIEPLMADADPVRFEQIVWNLLNNALKFTPDGGSLYLRLSEEDSQLRMDVRDTGEGIPAEFLPKIFDLFGQVPEKRLSSGRAGLGIGLSLVRDLVEAHHGRIEATSPGLGQGSTFSVWLPVYNRVPEQPAAPKEQKGQFEGLRVLVVDDSADIVEIMKALLEIEGADVTLAYDGAQALEIARSANFDLLLSDIGMPVMGGVELIRQMRQLTHHVETPAIALTGYGGNSDIDEAMDAGFDSHISKPVAFDLLLQTIVSLCGPRNL